MYLEAAYNFCKYFLDTKNEDIETLAKFLQVFLSNNRRIKISL